MAEGTTTGLWDALVPADAERLGKDILNPDDRKRWCGAVMFGGLPYLWNQIATVPRELALNKLELRRGDRVLIVGEAVADIGFDADVRDLVGDEGELVIVDMRKRVLDEFYAGRVPQWDWEYANDYADGYFDCVYVAQGVAHAKDWGREGKELLRVMKSGRRLVLAEISFSDLFYQRVAADVHLEYWVRKLLEGLGEDFDGLTAWNMSDVASELKPVLDELEAFEWRGVDVLWGRKP